MLPPPPLALPNPDQGTSSEEPLCSWIADDAVEATMASSSTIGIGSIAMIKPTAIHPKDWPSIDWACNDPSLAEKVCARGQKKVRPLARACDDPRTKGRPEQCAKPVAIVSGPSSLTARPLVKRSAMRLSSPP